jgi:hypothetical protein
MCSQRTVERKITATNTARDATEYGCTRCVNVGVNGLRAEGGVVTYQQWVTKYESEHGEIGGEALVVAHEAWFAAQAQPTATNSAMDAIAEQAEAFVSSVGASGSYVQFLNQFVEYVRQQHQ